MLLFLFFGRTIALASLAAGIIVQQVPVLLNLVCHLPKLGYKNYETGDDSVNVWWVALLTAGEGWHNNHHASPGSAKSGIRPYEFDPSWLMLRLMKAAGLVSWMNEKSPTLPIKSEGSLFALFESWHNENERVINKIALEEPSAT